MGCGGSLPAYTGLTDIPDHRSKSLSENKISEGDVEDILKGNFDVECPSTAKIVRIFTSSTFTDTLYERNSLIERVYPKLKEFCQSHGYEFQVVDMRWGIRDEATDDHMTSDLCLREVDQCKKLSTGPCFVTFLSHKYGYRYFPRQIESVEFEKIRQNLPSQDQRNLLDRWFLKDENAVPPTYILQPISSQIPSFLSKNIEDKKEARNQWNHESDKMQSAILETAKICLEVDEIERYQMSVTEVEIRRGILNCKTDGERSFWFHRVIDDIDNQPTSYLLSRYRECGNERHILESREMLEKLRDLKLKEALPLDHHKTYNIPWTDKGVDPISTNSHQQYINKLCTDFEEDMKEMISKAITDKEKSLVHSQTYQEVVQHASFCQEKCQSFYGRQNILSGIKSYILSTSNTPCVVYGKSGSGKTSVVAKAASNCRTWFVQKHVTILRFLGTTPESSSIGSLLLSITKQLHLTFKQHEPQSATTLRDIIDNFHSALKLASTRSPLILFLDSLDQLDPGRGARQLSWLPKKLPENVKMILSTLPEAQYEFFPKLKAMFSNSLKNNFLEVPNLPEKDAKGILDKWFTMKRRKLQPQQLKLLLNAFNQCPLPLFLKLSFDEACLWKSYTPVSQTVLDNTVRGIVNYLFSRVEALHGYILVSHALGYITLSKDGLTEGELEDILSCDDDVLNDVYVYWTPPIRRLPPLLLVRMRSELEQYFVIRGADGARVTYWYHRQFVEAARERYLSDVKSSWRMHGMLADYFSGVWANGVPKPISGQDTVAAADRHVSSQPLMFNETFNYRKINNLPYHRLKGRQLDLLKSECLCRYQFILATLKCRGLRQLLNTYGAVRLEYPEDEAIKSIEEVLQLSQNALQYNPDELPSQILGRLKPSKELDSLLEDCKKSLTYYLEPNQQVLVQPGGTLVQCLAQHADKPTAVDFTGQTAVTCSHDTTINVWDVENGRLLRTFDEVADKMDEIKLTWNNLAVIKCSKGFIGFNVFTGIEIYRIPAGISYCVCGPKLEYVCVATSDTLSMYHTATGKLIQHVTCQLGQIDTASICVGCDLYVAVTVNQRKSVVIFDIKNMCFINKIDGYCEALVFSPDSSTLYTTHKFKPALFVHDLKTLNCDTIPGLENIFAQGSLKITMDGRYVYFYYYSYVYVWDVESKTKYILIEHPTAITDVSTPDGRLVVTTGEDRAVRIWDLKRKTQIQEKKFDNGNDGARIMSTVLLENPRYAIFKIKRGFYWSWQLYDVYKQQTIKKSTKFVPNFEVVINNKQILLCGYTRVKLLDLTDMEFKVTYEGDIQRSQDKIITVINNGREFIGWSLPHLDIKIYDIKTGKINTCLTSNLDPKPETYVVNKEETFLIAQGQGQEQKTTFCVYDLKTKTLTTIFTSEDIGLKGDGVNAKDLIITPDGKMVLFKYKDNDNYYIIVCHLVTGKLRNRLEIEYIDKNKENIKYVLLSADTVLVYQEDAFMKLYNIDNGELIGEDQSGSEVTVPDSGPYFLTYGNGKSKASTKGNNAVRVWDRHTLVCLTSFYMDTEMRAARITNDGYHILLYTHTSGDPIVFQLKGGEAKPEYYNYKQLAEYPELFTVSGEDKDIQVLEKEFDLNLQDTL